MLARSPSSYARVASLHVSRCGAAPRGGVGAAISAGAVAACSTRGAQLKTAHVLAIAIRVADLPARFPPRSVQPDRVRAKDCSPLQTALANSERW